MGRPKGSPNKIIKREILARAALTEVERLGKSPLRVVLDVMDGLGRDGRPVDGPDPKPYTDRQIAAATAALPYTTPKLIAVKMQHVPPPDPKLEVLRHMTLDERRRFRELLAAVEARTFSAARPQSRSAIASTVA